MTLPTDKETSLPTALSKTSGRASAQRSSNGRAASGPESGAKHTPMVEEEQLLSGTERRNYLL